MINKPGNTPRSSVHMRSRLGAVVALLMSSGAHGQDVTPRAATFEDAVSVPANDGMPGVAVDGRKGIRKGRRHGSTLRSQPPAASRRAPAAQALRVQDYAFGGSLARATEDDLMDAVGRPSSLLRWLMVAFNPINPCYMEQPRLDGYLMRYKDETEVEGHPTADYVPGLYGTGWSGLVGKSRVGFGPVAVLRSGARPVGSVTVLVQSPRQHSPTRFSGVVNTYEGRHAVFYRVYVNEHAAPLHCFDVALPKHGGHDSPIGWLYYNLRGSWKRASFRPALVSGG